MIFLLYHKAIHWSKGNNLQVPEDFENQIYSEYEHLKLDFMTNYHTQKYYLEVYMKISNMSGAISNFVTNQSLLS